MTTKEIAVKLITSPLRYIRKELNIGHLELLSNSIMEKGKDWPFPPILLHKLATATKNGMIYEIVDGMHRLELARQYNYITIPAHIKEYKSIADLLADQFKENIHHGLLLSQADRNKWIKLLYIEAKMKAKDIGQQVGLTEASISRIIRELQATKDKKKVDTKKEDTKKSDQKEPIEFSIKKLKKLCQDLTSYIKDHKSTIESDITNMTTIKPLWEVLVGLEPE